MPQVFGPGSNAIVRGCIAGLALAVALVGYGAWAVWRSPYLTRVGLALDQPVPFSHEHHVSGLGIDCRYCHQSVESSPFAGLPSIETCMTCHSQVWTEAPVLDRLRESWVTGGPLAWQRVHDLPDFVYFDHSIHVQKGVGCSTCHGRVDRMPLMWKEASLQMDWCIECHRDPTPHLRPKSEVFHMDWKPDRQQSENGRTRAEEYQVASGGHLTDCGICHR